MCHWEAYTLKIDRRFFQGASVLNLNYSLNNECEKKGKRVSSEKLFSVCAALQAMRNTFNEASTTLATIAKAVGVDHKQQKNIDWIRNTVDRLKELDLIRFDFDVNGVKSVDDVTIVVPSITSNFLAIEKDEYKILKKLGMSTFFIYSALKNFVILKRGYSNMSMVNMAERLNISVGTIQRHTDILYALGIIDIRGGDFRKSEMHGEVRRSSNEYYIDRQRVLDVVAMEDCEIKQIIDGVNTKANKDMMRMSEWISKSYCSGITAKMVDRVLRHMDNVDKFYDIYDKKIMSAGGFENVSREFTETARVYAFGKVAKKKARVECMKLKLEGNGSKIKYENEKEIAK